VVPADDKKNAHLIIAEAIVETLKGMKMSYPRPGSARRKALESVRSALPMGSHNRRSQSSSSRAGKVRRRFRRETDAIIS